MGIQRETIGGLALAFTGAFLLATKGIFAKLLFARGWDFASLTASRALLALPWFWIFALVFGQPLRQIAKYPGAIIAAALAGFFSYYIGALLSFYALTLISAGLERTLLFTYPAFVLLLRWPVQGIRPSLGEIAVVVVAWLGVLLAVGAGADSDRPSLIGAAAVLCCALTLAGYFLVNKHVSDQIGSTAFTLVAMTAAAVGLVIHVAAFGPGLETLWPDSSDVGLMSAFVIGATVLPLFLVAEGVRRIGAARAALVTTIGPPTTIVLAWWLLGEALGPLQLLGTTLILAAIVVGEVRFTTPKSANL